MVSRYCVPLQDLDRFGAMRAFAAVGKRLSFIAAAEKLGISPSALSRRIAQLEELLGCRLLQRTTRRVTLTEARALYLDYCLGILIRSEEVDAAVSSHAREPQGVFRVTLPNLFGLLRVAPLLSEFMRRYPKLRLGLSFDDRYADLVRQRVGVGVRIGNLESGDYVARCASCHSLEPAARRAGPHLDGIVGRPAGAVAGFRYSAAMRSALEDGLVWDEATLDAFLASPREFLAGTSMRMALRNAAERAALIAYLRARAATGDGSS